MAEVNNPGMSQAQTDQMITQAVSALTIPPPAQAAPPSVNDAGAQGNIARYAMENHTHASKVRKWSQSISAATFTWTYPTPFGVGVVPIISAIAQVAPGNTDLFNVQVLGAPTNTSCQFQINRVSAGLLALLLGALSVNPTPATITLHMVALEP